MREIRKIADEHGLFVIEDNAQAIDAHGDDFKIGELSDAVCTSFIIQRIWALTATAAHSGRIARRSTTPFADCAIMVPAGATFTASASTVGWMTCTLAS